MSAQTTRDPAALDVFLIAAEESGDRLGAALMRALRERSAGNVRFRGVGGREMGAEGLASLYPIEDLSIIGFTAIPRRLPQIFRRMRMTVSAVLARCPHVLVLIDSPSFTRGVARRVRAAAPAIPIVAYVSPSVWAWRPGRARVMRAYVDHVLALLPFEPAVHRALGGPPCTYVGHPLIEEIARLRPNAEEMHRREGAPPVLLVLPGSRVGEIERLMGTFGEAVALLAARVGTMEVVLPTNPYLHGKVVAAAANWSINPRVVMDSAEKLAAFRVARAALAKSGTVTLELALSGVPMVTAYRVSWLEAAVARRMLSVPTVILANLVLGEKVIPEFLQEDCVPGKLAAALEPLLGATPQRQLQLDAFARLDAILGVGSSTPAMHAAEVVMETARPRA